MDPRDWSDLPDSARLAWWLTAVLAGRASPDELLAAVLGEDAAHHVTGLPDLDGPGRGESEEPEPFPLVLALGRLRRLGAAYAGLALPAEGDPLGLGGPVELNQAALEHGEAVVVTGANVGLVPVRAGRGVVWRCLPARIRQVPDVGEADRLLRLALLTAANTLADLDVARWRPELADELTDLRSRRLPEAPDGTPPACVALAARGRQAVRIAELALRDDGGALGATQSRQRHDAIRPLAAAGRRALVAACSPEAWPPR